MARPGAVICELNTLCGPTRRPALLLSCITLPPAFSIRLASCRHALHSQTAWLLSCITLPPAFSIRLASCQACSRAFDGVPWSRTH